LLLMWSYRQDLHLQIGWIRSDTAQKAEALC
jgi:hypothetical protein